MRDPSELLSFIRLPSFERSAKGLLDEAAIDELEETLLDDPRAGDPIAATGGVRKLRVALPGRGKRGGARVIYYYRKARGRVYLIYVYPKNQQANLTDEQKKEMRKLTKALDEEP